MATVTMENIHCTVISFKQLPNDPEYIYFVSDREIKEKDLYIDASKDNFSKVAVMYRQPLGVRTRRLEATNNPKYLLWNIDLQVVPESFVKAYFEGGKKIKEAPIRVNTINKQ